MAASVAVGGLVAFTAEAVKRFGVPTGVVIVVTRGLAGRDAVGVLLLARVATLIATPWLEVFVAEAFLLFSIPVSVLVNRAVVDPLEFLLDARVAAMVRSRSVAIVAEASTVLPVCIVVSRTVLISDYNTVHRHEAQGQNGTFVEHRW